MDGFRHVQAGIYPLVGSTTPESVAAQDADVLRRSPSTDKVEEQHLKVNTVESYVARSSGGCRRGPRLSEAKSVSGWAAC